MGDHTETLEIDFDPDILSYEELLDMFWDFHQGTGSAYFRQYMSLLLYHDDSQKEAALKAKAKWEEIRQREIQTEIAPFKGFTIAEDYHQKYYLQMRKRLMKKLSDLFLSFEAFNESTLAARLNGLRAGYGSLPELKKEIDQWNLSEEEREEARYFLSHNEL